VARTKSLALTSTFQDIVVLTVCKTVMVKEDESVAGYPTVNIQYRGSASDDTEELTAGKPKYIGNTNGKPFQVGDVAGQVACKTGSTTGVQYEE